MKLNNEDKWIVRRGFYLVELLEVKADDGFYIPREGQVQEIGKIVLSGEKTELNGELIDLEYREGDTVIFRQNLNNELEINDKKYYLVAENDVLIGTRN